MKYTHLIWDFDGMLFNTYPRMATAFSTALRDFGFDAPSEDVMARIKKSVRKASHDYAEQLGIDADALFRQYHLREHAMPPETMKPYPGIPELLRDAARMGQKHYLYTHRDASALTALEAEGIRDLFSDAIIETDGFPAKPAPDALLNLMKRCALCPSECLMLGDRSIDVEAARNAGIAGCLFDPEHFYDDFENDLRTDSVNGLRALLGL